MEAVHPTKWRMYGDVHGVANCGKKLVMVAATEKNETTMAATAWRGELLAHGRGAKERSRWG